MSLIHNHPGIVLGLVLVAAEAGLASLLVLAGGGEQSALASWACVGAGLLVVAGATAAYRKGHVSAAGWIAWGPVLLSVLLPGTLAMFIK